MSVGEMSLIPRAPNGAKCRAPNVSFGRDFVLFQFYILAIADVQEVLMTR